MSPLHRHLLVATVSLGLAFAAAAAEPAKLTVTVDGVTSGKPIPEAQALCTPTANGKSDKVKAPLRPAISWSGVPEEAKSIAVFMMDPDVPADFTDAGKEGKVLAKTAKRQDFFHYAVVNITPTVTSLKGGAASSKPESGTELVNDLGLNSYVDPQSAYGGPCPPWNDERVHNYHFIVLALDKDAPIAAPTLAKATPTADDPNTAKNSFNRLMASKSVLARGTVVGTYTLNPALRK